MSHGIQKGPSGLKPFSLLLDLENPGISHGSWSRWSSNHMKWDSVSYKWRLRCLQTGVTTVMSLQPHEFFGSVNQVLFLMACLRNGHHVLSQFSQLFLHANYIFQFKGHLATDYHAALPTVPWHFYNFFYVVLGSLLLS